MSEPRSTLSSSDDQVIASTVAVVLAGGGSARMSGVDKGRVELGDRRLIDLVIQRLVQQADRVLISGPNSYETGLVAVPDRRDGPLGPAAGIWSVKYWLEEHYPGTIGLVTAPVDGPFVPEDLVLRLTREGQSAIACGADGDHPTFAYWRMKDLERSFSQLSPGADLSLRTLSAMCNVRREVFADNAALFNVNTPEDLARAKKVDLESRT